MVKLVNVLVNVHNKQLFSPFRIWGRISGTSICADNMHLPQDISPHKNRESFESCSLSMSNDIRGLKDRKTNAEQMIYILYQTRSRNNVRDYK